MKYEKGVSARKPDDVGPFPAWCCLGKKKAGPWAWLPLESLKRPYIWRPALPKSKAELLAQIGGQTSMGEGMTARLELSGASDAVYFFPNMQRARDFVAALGLKFYSDLLGVLLGQKIEFELSEI